jgi:hypothetical protein
VVGAVALLAGTAGAVIARRWITPVRDDGAAIPPPPVVVGRPAKASPIRPADIAGETAEADGVANGRKDEGPGPKPAARSAPKRALAAAPSAAAVARERSEVLDALIALRREHDPVRAGTLLARYLAAHPHGTLREEALVLAIEAADGRGDRAAGAALARAYQGEYPAGRFLAFARSHLDLRPDSNQPRNPGTGSEPPAMGSVQQSWTSPDTNH